MSDYVFEFRGEKFVNIPGHPENHKYNVLTSAYKNKRTAIDNIKTRYLDSMKRQLNKQIKNQLSTENYNDFKKLFIDNEKGFLDLLNKVETQVVDNFNENVQREFSKTFGDLYKTKRDAFVAALKERKNRNYTMAKLNEIKDLFVNNLDNISFEKALNKETKEALITKWENVLNYEAFKNLVDKTFSSNNSKENNPSLNLIHLLETPSEFIELLLGDCEFLSDKIIGEEIDKKMIGRKSNTIKNKEIEIKNKAADLKFTKTLKGEDIGFKANLIINSFASVKDYQKNVNIKLVSSSNKSFVLKVLNRLYNYERNPRRKFNIFNSLALSYAEGEESKIPELNKNFRIIRSDLILTMAERLIAGFGYEDMQSVFIHNFKAYPMLLIIDNLVADLKNTLNSKKKKISLYGGNDRDEMFKLSITPRISIDRWVTSINEKGEVVASSERASSFNNTFFKKLRIARTIKNLEKLTVQGVIKKNFFEEYIRKGKIKGINLSK